MITWSNTPFWPFQHRPDFVWFSMEESICIGDGVDHFSHWHILHPHAILQENAANLDQHVVAVNPGNIANHKSLPQALIHFTWDLTSGDCTTLHVSDLMELEHEDTRDVWDPGWRVFSRHFLSGFIPAASSHCPRILTSIPVCQQRSLPALYWRNFALTLHGYCPAKKHRAPLVSE